MTSQRAEFEEWIAGQSAPVAEWLRARGPWRLTDGAWVASDPRLPGLAVLPPPHNDAAEAALEPSG